jgi:biopolymer transport protein ExbD
MLPVTHAPLRAEPNVTPMIDVMLVLLIIFMLVTPVIVNGMRAVPPSAAHVRAHPEEEADHTLGIDRNGEYYLDRRPVPAALLAGRLRTLYAGSTDRVLYLHADRDLGYAVVRDAMEIARESGVRVIGMIAEPPPDSRLPTPERL